MSKSLPDVRSVVRELGGVDKTAELFGRTVNAIWNWISADQFPADTYVLIQQKLKARRKSAPDSLWRMAKDATAKPAPARPDMREAIA